MRPWEDAPLWTMAAPSPKFSGSLEQGRGTPTAVPERPRMVLSRRTFSALACTTALGLTLSGGDGAFARASTPTGPAPEPPGADGTRHTVGFDKYSMWSTAAGSSCGPARSTPSGCRAPPLWRTSWKSWAHGYNTISVYVSWNYHSPAPWTTIHRSRPRPVPAHGRRDRPVRDPAARPVHQRRVDAGGFPGWLTATRVPHLRPDLSVVRRRVADRL